MDKTILRWIPRLALVAFLVLPGVAFATANHKVQLISPETPQSWSYGSMTDHRLIWNSKKKEFRVQLTFSNQDYSSETDLPEKETYQCPFPKVTFDEASGIFSAKSPKGFSVPLAKRVNVLFGTQIELLPTSRVVIFNVHGRLIVTLTGTTNSAFATGQNKWIVRSKGWYLQNLF